MSKSDVGFVLLFIFLLLGLPVLALALREHSCLERWKDSGLSARWALFSGCQIQVKEKWIPAANYREM